MSSEGLDGSIEGVGCQCDIKEVVLIANVFEGQSDLKVSLSECTHLDWVCLDTNGPYLLAKAMRFNLLLFTFQNQQHAVSRASADIDMFP